MLVQESDINDNSKNAVWAIFHVGDLTILLDVTRNLIYQKKDLVPYANHFLLVVNILSFLI